MCFKRKSTAAIASNSALFSLAALARLTFQMGSEELRQRMRLLDNEIRIMRSDQDRIRHESTTQVSHT